MNGHALLIDFGASRIKSALVDLSERLILSKHSSPGSAFIGPTVPTKFFADALVEHLNFAKKGIKITAIFICCEMHGFAKTKAPNDDTREYFSWRYSSVADDGIISALNSKNFKKITGMHPRKGLPVVSLLSKMYVDPKFGVQNEAISFLPDEICRLLGHSNNRVHASLAHASGLFNNENERLTGFGLETLSWPKASPDDCVEVGQVKFDDRYIPCFGGYGDLQASVFGVRAEERDWIINLGTGSQIITFANPVGTNFEKRQFFNQKEISCVTHIPAGRTLNMYAQFFQEVRQESDSDYFWKKLSSVSAKSTTQNNPKFELATFPEAVNFQNGGAIKEIFENEFGVETFFQGLLYSFLKQYHDILVAEDPSMDRPISIAGNMAVVMPNIRHWFTQNWKSEIKILTGSSDPTIDGMYRVISEKFC